MYKGNEEHAMSFFQASGMKYTSKGAAGLYVASGVASDW